LEVYTRRLHEMGWRVLLYTAGQGEEVDDLLPEVLAYQVDGLIIISSQLSSRMADEVLARGTPVVLFNRYVRGSRASAVCCDNYGGGRLVAQTLLERGYRHLAYIAGPEETLTNQDRERGFGEYLTQHGIGEWLREPGNYTYEAGFAATARLLGRSDPPQAIFCGNDITAIGALDAARELKRLVPADIAIIGFDGIPQGNWGAYALTTVRQPMEAMIERSLGLLLERIASPELEVIHEFLPGTLVERGSLRQVGNQGHKRRSLG
jgi:DNA-binding LacI/PurR family transcriptional regulator